MLTRFQESGLHLDSCLAFEAFDKPLPGPLAFLAQHLFLEPHFLFTEALHIYPSALFESKNVSRISLGVDLVRNGLVRRDRYAFWFQPL